MNEVKCVGEHIKEWLIELGADGLCNGIESCSCSLDDLFLQYGCAPTICFPARRVRCSCGREFFVTIDLSEGTCPKCGNRCVVNSRSKA